MHVVSARDMTWACVVVPYGRREFCTFYSTLAPDPTKSMVKEAEAPGYPKLFQFKPTEGVRSTHRRTHREDLERECLMSEFFSVVREGILRCI